MNEFVKYEVWQDYWCFKPSVELELHKFKRLNYSSTDNKNEIQIRIESDRNTDKPSNYQAHTLQFVLDHQSKIIESIFDYYRKVIFPVYNEGTDIEKGEIAHNESELHLVFGVLAIEIPRYERNDSNYFIINFDFAYDAEHGLSILFENTNPIDFFEESGKSYEAVNYYHDGLINDNGEPLKINLYKLNGETVFQIICKYDELIKFNLFKGTYRTFITVNQNVIYRNFHVPEDLDEFTPRKILTYG